MFGYLGHLTDPAYPQVGKQFYDLSELVSRMKRAFVGRGLAR